MLKQKLFLVIMVINSTILLAQNNTNSPYSLFGLGIENKTATAGLTGLGNTGIAQSNPYQINISNPASLGNIRKSSFLYEFGVNASFSELKNSTKSESTSNGNISHIAIAFPIQQNWGVGIGLLPYTKVGYSITSQSSIEGSLDDYYSIISGEGGLNKFYISTGITLGKGFSLGLDASFLFGTINQTNQTYSSSLFTISDENHYSGIKLTTGFQYSFFSGKNKKTTIGGTFELPTYINGTQVRNSFKTSNLGTTISVEEETENELNEFSLPIVTGLGVTSNLYKDFTASFDFKNLLWEETEQAEDSEQYLNQNIYAFGLEYTPSGNKLKYLNRLKYRFGFNYNTGFLEVSNKQIDSHFVSLGLGIPLSRNSRNIMNLSYSYGKEGNTDNKLIQENFHKITLNLSFVGDWFKKRKIF